MGWLARSIAAPMRRNVAFSESFWPELLVGRKSAAGPTVTVDSAFGATAVLACSRVTSEDVAQVSKDVFRKRKDGGSDVFTDHPLHDLLLSGPNDWQTGHEFFEQVVIHTGLSGRFLAFKNYVRGELRELLPIEPACSRVEVDHLGRRRYFLKPLGSDAEKEYPPEAIWHVKGPSWNGWDGMEIMRLARDAIGLSLAMEESHSLMHANGSQQQGVYSLDATLRKEQYESLRAWIETSQVGANRFRPMILDRGAKFLQTSMTGVDAQHLETRKFQIEEICRVFRVLPIMIGYSDKTATFASASEMFAAHVKYTLGAWFSRLEGSINKNLLSRDERMRGLYFKFLPVSLLRGNAKDRGEFYWKLWQMGALNANEIRAYEELNPYTGGEQYRVPSNTVPSDQEPPEEEPGVPAARTRRNVGRVLSGRNERRIRDADGLLNEVLDELDEDGEAFKEESHA